MFNLQCLNKKSAILKYFCNIKTQPFFRGEVRFFQKVAKKEKNPEFLQDFENLAAKKHF